jgi:hypothetical protein
MLLGTALAPAARGAANATEYLANSLKGIPAPLRQFERESINRVTRAAGDDARTGTIPGLASQYGPEGMIADIGPNVRGQIGAIARTPGEGQTIALNALNQRAGGAPDRITGEINRTLGPEINLPQALDTIEKSSARAAKPFYDTFRETPVPFTRDLEGILNTLKNEPSVLRDARRMADLDSASGPRQFFAKIADDGSVTIDRVPSASEWDYVKRALDGLAYSSSASKNDQRVYGGLAKKITSTIDEILSPLNPSRSPWAQGRAASSDGFKLTEAMDSGRGAFSRGISPDEMAAEIAGMSRAEQAAYTLAGRQSIRDTMGNASTKWGANEDTAARKMLGSDYARQKLEILAGRQNADRLTRTLDSEAAFDATREAARGNSVTAAMTAAQKEFPNVADQSKREIGSQSAVGLGLRGIRALTDALTGGVQSERNAAIARDAAKMLTAQGSDRDAIAAALQQFRDGRAMSRAGRDSVERLLNVLGMSTRQEAIDQTNSFFPVPAR